MNQNDIQKAIETNDLHLSIDLRVEQNIRLEAIAPVMRTLKERIGSIHASATIAYCEQNHPKYINLPVYITENAEARILNLFFPAQVKVTIWEENQEKPINFLQYHLDKRTEALTEISGIADVNDNSNVIIIPVDFTKTYDEYVAETEALANKYYQNNNLFNKPIYINYIWKNDYTATNATKEEYLIPGVTDSANNKKINFSSSYKIIEADEPTIPKAFSIDIYERRGAIKVNFNDYVEPEVIPDTFFLYADDSRVISLADIDLDFPSTDWLKFRQILLTGKKPAVYLKTYDTDKYYPASYYFQWNADKTDMTTGVIEIQYVKEIDNKFHLCVDKMEFTDFAAGIYGPDETVGETVKHFIQRIPLN